MRFSSRFTFPMIREPKQKSYEWILSEKKVLLEAEVKILRKFCNRLRKIGLKNEKFCLVRGWFMVELGLFTGLRVEEMTGLKVKDVIISDRHASIFVRRGKGGKKRTVWINNKFKHICNDFLKLRGKFSLHNDVEQFLFTSQKGKPITKRALQKQFKVFFRWACIDERKFLWYGNEGADVDGERRWPIPLSPPLVLAGGHCHKVNGESHPSHRHSCLGYFNRRYAKPPPKLAGGAFSGFRDAWRRGWPYNSRASNPRRI